MRNLIKLSNLITNRLTPKSLTSTTTPTLNVAGSRFLNQKEHFSGQKRDIFVSSQTQQIEKVTASGNFKVSVENGLRTISLNRPKKYNALLTEMFSELASLLDEASADKETVLTAVTGEGDFFCAGNDLTNMKDLSAPGGVEKFIKNVEILCAAHINFDKAIVCVVNGPSVGYGVTALAFYDAVYASDKATFHAPFTALGQCPEMGSSYTFPRIMGRMNAAQLLLFNQKINAAKAKELGLVTEVFPHATLRQDVKPILQSLAQLPPNSLKFSKGLIIDDEKDILHKINMKECAGLIKLAKSEEAARAIAKFFSRKK